MAIKPGHIVGVALLAVGGTLLYQWIKKQLPANEQVVGQDEHGEDIIEVTGSDGTKIRGLRMPSDFGSLQFPLIVVVKPDQEVMGKTGGQDIIFRKGSGSMELVWNENYVWYPNVRNKILLKINSLRGKTYYAEKL